MKSTVEPVQVSERPAGEQAVEMTEKSHSCEGVGGWVNSASLHFSPSIRELFFVGVSVQFSCSVMSNFATPGTAACQASLSITNSRSLLQLLSFESVMPSNHLILCCPLLLPSSVFPSIRVFLNESVLCIRWPTYCSLEKNISLFRKYSVSSGIYLFYCHLDFCLPSVLFPIIFISFSSPSSSTSFSMKFPLPGPLATEKTFKKNFYFLLCFVFIAACWLFSSCGQGGLLPSLGAQASHCSGFSCFGAWALELKSFSCCSSQVLEDRFDSCAVWGLVLPRVSDFPGSGIQLVSPALAGGFFTTELPMKPSTEKTLNPCLLPSTAPSRSTAHIDFLSHNHPIGCQPQSKLVFTEPSLHSEFLLMLLSLLLNDLLTFQVFFFLIS